MNKQLEQLQAELAAGEPELEQLLQGLHRLDRAAWRMNLLKHNDSMLEHLYTGEQPASISPDEPVPAMASRQLTTALTDMIDRLEQHVGWVMQAMNRWCLSVLAWELGLLVVLTGLVMVLATVVGQGPAWPVLQQWWAELLARPISLTVYSALLLIIAAAVHYRLRKKIAAAIAMRLDEMEPFDTPRAFLKNTRIWHSIFRPQPVGWAGRAQEQLNGLRRQLNDTMAHTTQV